MKVVELLESRRQNWRALEGLCQQMENGRQRRVGAAGVARFAALYRAACADLALADAYQLPPGTVHFLHQLVGRAHNQLYRSRTFDFAAWGRELFHDVPRRLVRDRVLWLAMALFWGIFIGSAALAYVSPQFCEQVLGEQATQLQESFSEPIEGRPADQSSTMAGFYIQHNTDIGLQCFAFGLFLGVGGLLATVFNAAFLGAAFGFMATVPEGENFFHFVTAHGPFELTAIVLSAGAGMRLGFSLVDTQGLARIDSLTRAARETMPAMGAAMILFMLAAMIEGFLSPSSASYWVKALTAIISTALLLFYVFGLGLGGRRTVAAG